MSDKLKIYACSGIGETDGQEQQVLQFWTDGTNTLSNTQAINGLLAKINLLYIQVTRSQDDWNVHKLDKLNDIDMLSVCLEAAKHFATDNDGLHRAGEVIAHMIDEGAFEFSETDSEKREAHLEELIDQFYAIHNDGEPLSNVSPDFMDWWKINVEDRNKVGLNFGQQQNVRKALKKAVAGIGEIDPRWKENEDLANYLLNGATYFLYTYFTDAQLAKLPAAFKVKRKGQLRIYNYCKSFFVDQYGTEEDMQSIIRAGIIAELGGEPEQICADMLAKQTKGTGSITTAIVITVKELIQIISIIAGVLVAIVYAICDCVYKSNAKKYSAIDQSVVDNSVPDEDELSALERLHESGSLNGNSWIAWAAAGLGLLFILKS